MHVTLDDGRTVAIEGAVAEVVAAVLAIAPELPASGYKLTLDVGRDGSVRPAMQRNWAERKPVRPLVIQSR